MLTRAMYRGYGTRIHQHEVGLLDDREWEHLENAIIQAFSDGEASVL